MLHKIALSTVITIFATTAFAGIADIKASNNLIGLRAMSTYVDYTETGNGLLGTQTGILDTETGPVAGLAFSVSRMRDLWLGNDYLEFSFDYSSGYTKYTGSYQGGTYGSVVTTSRAVLSNLSARYGRGTILHEKFMLTPYAELARHEWYRGVNYGEIYSHYHFAIGVLGQYSPVRRLVLTANAMLGNTFSSYISVASSPSSNGFAGSLGNSPLYKAGLAADYAFTRNLHGNIGIEHMRFNYGISGIYDVGGGYVAWEPDSETKYSIVKLGLGYAF
ncbi:MAG: hypothetical protein WC236_00460 [Gallionellaceae bacterium]|jgi:hypothetical protein